MSTYKFVKSFDDIPQQTKLYYFYQVCLFPKPRNNKYYLRKFTLDENNEFVGINVYKLTKKQIKHFVANKQPHEYKSYSTYDLNMVEYPHSADILTMKSDILGNHYDYYGHAPF